MLLVSNMYLSYELLVRKLDINVRFSGEDTIYQSLGS